MDEPKSKAVLIVEDDLFLSDILAQKLAESAFHVEAAVDSKDAFKILGEKHIDLIILDLLLPGVSGQEILKQIKDDEQLKSIPVIIASNLDNPEEQHACMKLGAVDYLIKAQHTPDEIIDRVKKALKME